MSFLIYVCLSVQRLSYQRHVCYEMGYCTRTEKASIKNKSVLHLSYVTYKSASRKASLKKNIDKLPKFLQQ